MIRFYQNEKKIQNQKHILLSLNRASHLLSSSSIVVINLSVAYRIIQKYVYDLHQEEASHSLFL